MIRPLLLLFIISSLVHCSHREFDAVSGARSPAQSAAAPKELKRLDIDRVLFGIEYSFQDEHIIREKGRMTFQTEDKLKKFHAMSEAYLKVLGLDEDAIVEDTVDSNFKPGYIINIPNDGDYTINMEPVTIEVNTTPKTYHEILDASGPIFEAAEKAELVPYVQPAAERSGMGHIHVGARTLKESPLFQNHNLLRNIFVYYHKHPSLLYGFAEAYDIGDNSNIETFHAPARQKAFQDAVQEFDLWFKQVRRENLRPGQGMAKFLSLLKKHEPAGHQEFFHHYRFLNLEHLKRFALEGIDESDANLEGKFTLEHRTFRPQKSPRHALANAELLLDMYDHLSAPDLLEPFEYVGVSKFKSFWTASVIEDDWNRVKKALGHNNRYSDEMLGEALGALRSGEVFEIDSIPNAQVFRAFSQKEFKGQGFELRVESRSQPIVATSEGMLDFYPTKIEGKTYWVSYVDAVEMDLSVEDIQDGSAFTYRGKKLAGTCRNIVRNFLSF